MTLRLRDYGIATAYATVGVSDVEAEKTVIRTAASELRAKDLSSPEIIFLLGQADIATIYETKNFKRIFDLRYPRAGSYASVVNWVFSTPLAGGRTEPLAIGEAPFRFMIHLRLRRAVYAYRGIEEKIFDKLTTLLGQNRHGARIHVGLGWSDLIVEGYFTENSFHDLVDFIIQAHGLRIAHGADRRANLPVLQRILTVFGYRGEEPPAFTTNGHLTFLRCKPGSYDLIPGLFGPHERIEILDGKADFMIRSNAPDPDAEDPRARDPKWLVSQRNLGGDKQNKPILRKVETHLMFFSANEFIKRSEKADLLVDVGDEILHEEECGCDTSGNEIFGQIEKIRQTLGRRLPTEQRYAIDNALFLLDAALRDSSTCCDMRDAVIACCGGLLQTLEHVERNAAALSPEHYEQMWRHLDDWHRLSELLLRQRMVGSYEEILGTSDRSIVYSGGVQKFLYLADQVMMDFARRIQPIDPPKFATIYDSVKTIFSSFTSGHVVRIPTSQIFSFPLIVPDLWHEVAGALFFLRFQKAFEELEPKPEGNYNDFLANVADQYADLMVYLYGFRGDFTKFAVSLFHGWRLAYRDAPEEVHRRSRGHFLLRLYLVFEFDKFRAVQRTGSAAKAQSVSKETVDAFIGELRNVVTQLRSQLASVMELSDVDWLVLRRNVVDSEWFHYVQRQLYWPFVETVIDGGDADLTRFEKGTIVELDETDDLNALFGELGYRLARAWPQTDFQITAALGESAALEYHRRQMTRQVRQEAKADG